MTGYGVSDLDRSEETWIDRPHGNQGDGIWDT